MAQAALDDRIANLQSFCNLLAETTATVARDAQVLEARGDGLERAQTGVQERMEHVGERLETALEELTQAQAAAVEETERLAEAAEDLVPSRLSESDADLERGETAFEERLSHERADLETDFLDLSPAGFTALSTVLDEVEAGLTKGGEDSISALENLGTGLAHLVQRAGEVHQSTVAALDAADQELREGWGQELEGATAAHVTLWTNELPATVEAECTGVGDPLEALYDGWEQEIVAEGDELSEAVSTLIVDAAESIANEAGQALAESADGTARGSLQVLVGELEGLLPVLAEGEAAAEGASALVDDLVVVRRVVSQIDQLLNALQE